MKDSDKLRDYFYGWQCRLRQHAVRKADGRPSQGMQATLSVKSVEQGRVITGLVKQDASEVTSEFRHIVKKTHDPNLRHQAAIKLLSSVYYQYPKDFLDSITATFATDSKLAKRLVKSDKCDLCFQQHQQQFNIPCTVKLLDVKSDAYQATYWHNHMFNPVMPAEILVLGFSPRWQKATAAPEVA